MNLQDWTTMTPHQRLALIDLMQATIQAEIQPMLDDINRELDAANVPARLEIDVRLAIDPNRDPRLFPKHDQNRKGAERK
jgi:hypothetical protein